MALDTIVLDEKIKNNKKIIEKEVAFSILIKSEKLNLIWKNLLNLLLMFDIKGDSIGIKTSNTKEGQIK